MHDWYWRVFFSIFGRDGLIKVFLLFVCQVTRLFNEEDYEDEKHTSEYTLDVEKNLGPKYDTD